MRRRLLAWAAALAITLSLLPATAMAAGAVLTVKTPATIPKAGESFLITVDISDNPGIGALQFTLAFDQSAMVCTDAHLSEAFRGAVSATNEETPTGAIVAAASSDAMTDNGTVATFQFTAKKDIRDFGFALEEVKLNTPAHIAIPYTVNFAQTAADSAAQTPPSGGQSQSAPEGETGAVPLFPDAVGHWGEEWIVKAAQRGLFSGDERGSFHPDANISRGDYVLVLWRMAGKPAPKQPAPFADVMADDYYADAVAWAYENGYVNGKGSGFAPKDSLTRQEAMKILFGYAGSPSGMELMFTADYDAGFADSAQIAAWAKAAMYWAYYNGIISGTGAKTLGPTVAASRAQLAKILVGYLEKRN
ncbi:MAG: S-layer homology domain-containing protein [Oscillospiraceae bacterium]|nr:S-layer homology domain-containing protein [Oscillospiraceae bacterium]